MCFLEMSKLTNKQMHNTLTSWKIKQFLLSTTTATKNKAIVFLTEEYFKVEIFKQMITDKGQLIVKETTHKKK